MGGKKATLSIGNIMPIGQMPEGTIVCQIKRNLVIEVRSLKLQAVTAPSSPTTPTPAKPESSFPPESKSSTDPKTEPCSASSPVVDESTSQCLKPDELTTSSESRGTVGQRFEVSPRIQSNIPTVVVIINISVNHLPSGETLLQVKRSVLLPPDEPDEFEVPGLLTTKRKNNFRGLMHKLFLLFFLIKIFRKKSI